MTEICPLCKGRGYLLNAWGASASTTLALKEWPRLSQCFRCGGVGKIQVVQLTEVVSPGEKLEIKAGHNPEVMVS